MYGNSKQTSKKIMRYIAFSSQDEILRAHAKAANEKFKRQKNLRDNPKKQTPTQTVPKTLKKPKKLLQNKWVRRGAFGLGGLGVLAGGTALTMGALNRRKRRRQS